MEILLGLIVVILLGGVLISLLGAWLGGGVFFWTQRMQKKAEARAPEILDELFNGREDVVYKVNLESLKYETVVLGAKQRGYRLASETNDTADGVAKTLIFERVDAS